MEKNSQTTPSVKRGGHVNANRGYTTDPLVDIKLGFPVSVRDAIDRARGDQSRNQWIREACEAWLEAGRDGDECPF